MRSRQQNALPEAAQPHFSSTGITSARLRGTRRRLKGVFAEIRYCNSHFLIVLFMLEYVSRLDGADVLDGYFGEDVVLFAHFHFQNDK